MNAPSTRIVSAGNVLAPALAEVVAAGYKVELSADGSLWQATNSKAHLVAEDPLSLLGLVKLYDTRGTDWAPTDQEVGALLAHNPEQVQPAVAERAEVWEEAGAVHMLCATREGDPVELSEQEARAFAERLAQAIKAAR